MITVSGRCLARAWLAVAHACSDDEARPVLTAMRVEEYDDGLLLVATDSYWIAYCWVPGWDAVNDAGVPFASCSGGAGSASLAVAIDDFGLCVRAASVLDPDGRVRDLMSFLVRATKGKDAVDQPVIVDLESTIEPDEDEPTLLPEWAKPAARFELLSRERVFGPVIEGDTWVDWRAMVESFEGGEPGMFETTFSEWMLDRLSRVARAVGAGTVSLRWFQDSRALWWVPAPALLHHVPRGVLMTHRDRTPAVPSPTTDDESLDGMTVTLTAGETSVTVDAADIAKAADDLAGKRVSKRSGKNRTAS